MKTKIAFFIIICSFNILNSNAELNLNFIKEVQSYQNSVRIKYNSTLQRDTIDENTFHLKTYLAMFNEIEFDKNYKFGYIYFDNFLDGNPYIYAVKESFNFEEYIKKETFKRIKTHTIYRTQTEYTLPFDTIKRKMPPEPEILQIHYSEKEFNQASHFILHAFLNDSINRGYNHVKPSDTKNSYLQYLFFRELGENFALKWHAAYWDKYIICSKADINSIIEEYGDNQLFDVKKKDLNKLLQIDAEPVVKLDSEICTITWYEVNTYSGVDKRTYEITRSFPYIVKLKNEETTVNFGPMFNY